MSRYRLHGLTLDVASSHDGTRAELDRLLRALSCEDDGSSGDPDLSIDVRLGEAETEPVSDADREVLRVDGFRGTAGARSFVLTGGGGRLRIEYETGRLDARLSPEFFETPRLDRESFWAYGLLKLLRRRGWFSLHAAALVDDDGDGLLLVGDSGCGKSTLAIALIRQGWRFVSDDAVLLRSGAGTVEALALRRDLYVDGAAAELYADLGVGERRTDRTGGERRRLDVDRSHAAQRGGSCVPRRILFPRIVADAPSRVSPVDAVEAFVRLLAQSGSQLFDRSDADPQVALLNRLLRQAPAYDFHSGPDVLSDPASVGRLVAGSKGEKPCLASSSS